MVHWKDYGTRLSVRSFAWATGDAYAAQCVCHEGKFYWFVATFQRNADPNNKVGNRGAAGTKPEMIAYCTAPTATRPWTYQGIIQGNVLNSFMTPPGIIDYKAKSYFFYHNGSLLTGGSYHRSICVDEMHYNADGTSQPKLSCLPYPPSAL